MRQEDIKNLLKRVQRNYAEEDEPFEELTERYKGHHGSLEAICHYILFYVGPY